MGLATYIYRSVDPGLNKVLANDTLVPPGSAVFNAVLDGAAQSGAGLMQLLMYWRSNNFMREWAAGKFQLRHQVAMPNEMPGNYTNLWLALTEEEVSEMVNAMSNDTIKQGKWIHSMDSVAGRNAHLYETEVSALSAVTCGVNPVYYYQAW